MGTYNLSPDEIAVAMENADVENECEGDFTEDEFVKGAKEYLRRLRKQGAKISKK